MRTIARYLKMSKFPLYLDILYNEINSLSNAKGKNVVDFSVEEYRINQVMLKKVVKQTLPLHGNITVVG